MEATASLDRRARLRAATTAEIKQVALTLMAAGGPDAITLRAIAREMGMTPNAIYGYFATRDDLATALISDVSTDLADVLDATWARTTRKSPAERIRAWASAFRSWALTNPEGFRLVFGDPIPGYIAPEGGPAPDATRRICLGLTGLAAVAWPHAESDSDRATFQWSDFDPGLRDEVRAAFPELPPAALALAMRIRARLHGLVSLEVYGHLQGVTPAPDKLFDADLADLLNTLGLTGAVRP
ncbi:TetR/AcrR family transcriptional regulator [Diaminobutyricibacter sp. McL0618]|uniref:TetR/AcrR family transcriptional regulator n=1 Tax=Leifsonia sp. McL0618 TaxID=3415677 RepID=UPI003CF638C7